MRTLALLLLPFALSIAIPAYAEPNPAKAKTLHDSAKKAFEEATKEHTAAMKHLEDAGSAESRADAKWQEAARLEAEARRFEPAIELKIVQGERVRRRAERMETRAAIDERIANNLEARSKRAANQADGVRDDAVAIRKLTKTEKDAKTKERLDMLAKLDDELAKDLDKDAVKFKTQSDALRKEAKALRDDAEKLVQEAHKLDGK